MNSLGSMDFTLFQIKLFFAVAETNSFSRAAEKMHMEQSTLSRRIAMLEQELGFVLFNRESRPISLTQWGQVLYEQWKPLVSAMEQSLSMIHSQRKQDAGRLNVCMLDSGVQLNDIPGINILMREAYPDVTLMFHYTSISHWQEPLRDGSCDVAVTVGFDIDTTDTDLVTQELRRVPKLACVLRSNPLSRKERLTFEDLRDQKFVSIADSASPRHAEYVRKLCNTHGFEPQFGGRSSNAHGLTSML